ncbi:MAG: hypothetical protein ABDH19_02330 [Thermodesulfovibrio sp.]
MSLLRLLVVSLIILLFSNCAEKKVTVKDFYAENIEDFIKRMENYNSLEAVLNLQYEAKNNILNGDALLRISKNEFLLRIYYLGFPIGEIYEEDGEISSNLNIEKDRLKQLAIGVKKSFLWWNGNFTITEEFEKFILKDGERTIILKKDGFIPLKQTLNVDNQTISITYDEHKKIKTEDGTIIEMPFLISVSYKNKTLRIKIEKINIKNA